MAVIPSGGRSLAIPPSERGRHYVQPAPTLSGPAAQTWKSSTPHTTRIIP
jgi:hypothetical protein